MTDESLDDEICRMRHRTQPIPVVDLHHPPVDRRIHIGNRDGKMLAISRGELPSNRPRAA
jgi:hypothetical protein